MRQYERESRTGTEAGFSLIEMLVAVTLVGFVMTAVSTFFIRSLSVTEQQTGKQVAVQLADDAVERARAFRGSEVADGRTAADTRAQWNEPMPGVEPYLSSLRRFPLSQAEERLGAGTPLPIAPRTVTVNGLEYDQHWYIGQCWQPLGGGDCTTVPANDTAEFFKIVVAVTWSFKDCPDALCSFVTSTLVSKATGDPVFNSNESAQRPRVNNPGARAWTVGVPIAPFTITATDGAPPLTWQLAGQPTGLTINSATGVVSGTPTAVGSFSTTVSATDTFNLVGTAVFTYTINPAPNVTSPGNQTSQGGVSATPVTAAYSGGTAPYTWAVTRNLPSGWGATGLPPGLSLNPSTGVISGSPTVSGGPRPVQLTVTDAAGQASSVTFQWTVPGLVVTDPPDPQTGEVTVPMTPLQISATGGVKPYSWIAANLPAGLTIDVATGVIAGTPTAAGTTGNVIVTVTDATGASAQTRNTRWVINAAPRINSHAAVSNPRNSSVNEQFTLVANSGTAPFTWSATSLPTGLSIASTGTGGRVGLVSGTPTANGQYQVTITVTDALGARNSISLTWTVTGGGFTVTNPTTNRTGALNVTVNLTATASGGGGNPSWTQTGLPLGLSMTTSGVITGKPTATGAYPVKLTVTSTNKKETAVFMFTWTIT